ncbi:MAG TPA: hypothetical protein VD978_36080 [Azospirillum sp.]|nr:hypothetical protein [Azospirillum sp.]
MSRQILRLFLFSVAVALIATPASAGRTRVGIGLSFGFPLFFGPPIFYAPPPPVVFAPPPVVFAPPAGLSATPTSPTFVGPSGAFCREFETSARVGGRIERLFGTACQQPDGTWRVVR